MVEFSLLLPVVAAMFGLSILFYQGFIQENLYGSNANYERSYDADNPALGQEMIVALPLP
jgi:hypothetical protein